MSSEKKIGGVFEGSTLLFRMITVAQQFESLALHDLVQSGAPEDPVSLSDDMTYIHLFCDTVSKID